MYIIHNCDWLRHNLLPSGNSFHVVESKMICEEKHAKNLLLKLVILYNSIGIVANETVMILIVEERNNNHLLVGCLQ